mgnify:CR=1 FL=1
MSATESKKHLFIAFKTFQHYDFTNNVYRISPKDSSQNDSTVEHLKPRVILSNGVLVTCDKTNNEHTVEDISNLILTIYNLEVLGLEMLKLASNQILNTYYSIGKVRDVISYPYFVHPEQNLNVQGEDKGYFSVSIWNLQTGEMVKRLHFNFEKDGDPGGVMLRSNILVIRFKEYDDSMILMFIDDEQLELNWKYTSRHNTHDSMEPDVLRRRDSNHIRFVIHFEHQLLGYSSSNIVSDITTTNNENSI